MEAAPPIRTGCQHCGHRHVLRGRRNPRILTAWGVIRPHQAATAISAPYRARSGHVRHVLEWQAAALRRRRRLRSPRQRYGTRIWQASISRLSKPRATNVPGAPLSRRPAEREDTKLTDSTVVPSCSESLANPVGAAQPNLLGSFPRKISLRYERSSLGKARDADR